jgi:hypothetical protein
MARYTEMVLNGHGGWNLKETPAWAQVPRGTTIKFLTENMRLMMLPDIDNEQTALKILQQFREASASDEKGEYGYVPNYVLSPDGVSGAPDWVYQVSSDTPLCTSEACSNGIHDCDGVFADPDVVGATLYWGACRYVGLEEAGDLVYYAETGVNQRQPEFGDEGLDEGVGYTLANSTVDAFLQELAGMGSEEEISAKVEQIQSQLSPEQWDMVSERVQERIQQLGG